MPDNQDDVDSATPAEEATHTVAREKTESEVQQDSTPPEEGGPEQGFYRRGTDVLTGQVKPSRSTAELTGGITLNLEDTPIAEAAKIILGDLLNENYTVDQRVQGTVTLQTSRPIPRDSLVPTLELLLRMNNAALIEGDRAFRIVPRELALQQASIPQLGDSMSPLPKGYSIRIVPLQFIAASEMQKILEPLIQSGNLVRVDQYRNLLIIAGSSQEISRMLEMVQIFDVDWLEGMSVALFTPEFVEAKTLTEELQKVFDEGPLAGLMRFMPIERLNALLVMSPRKQYLDKASQWVDRLDRSTDVVGRRLYVYKVQNGKATELAEVLGKVFTEQDARGSAPRAELAPGLEPVEISTITRERRSEPGQGQSSREDGGELPRRAQDTSPSSDEQGVAVSRDNNIRIIADEVNNALVILGTPEQYAQIKSALRRLDIAPLQVLIEATIAEITLTDEFRFGLEWFFNNNINEAGVERARATLDLDSSPDLGVDIPGFSYALTDAAGVVRGVLNMLAADSKLNVISSPSLMVLNNQTASIQVGDQVPVTRQQQQATTGQANVINSIEFRDTGVQLTVTPRVNSGGLVTMEIQQEVSDVAPGSSELTPTIQQRKINSTVAVESGETVVLGGLIRENQSQGRSGLPLLYQIPVLGPLFGSTNEERRRTELVVLITPRAVQGAEEAREITEEFRKKMESLEPLYNRTTTGTNNSR